MQERMPDWEDLRAFLAVARAGSLSAGARALGVDQSTVSRRVASLESTLGARLFDRVPGGVVLTPAAREALGLAEEGERRLGEFVASVAGADQGVRGAVRLALPDGVDTALVLPDLPALLTRHPGLCVELVADNAVADLGRREADLALRFVRPDQGPWMHRRLAHLTSSVYAGVDLVDQPFTAHAWVEWDQRLPGHPDVEWANRHVPPHRVRLRANRVDARLAAIRAGLGAGILPDALAARDDRLARVAVPEPVPGCDLWIVATRPLYDVPRVRVIWDFLVDVAARRLVAAPG